MNVYEITYRFDASGETVQRETRVALEEAPGYIEEDMSVLATGISIDEDSFVGEGYVASPHTLDGPQFPDAESVRSVDAVGRLRPAPPRLPGGISTEETTNGWHEDELSVPKTIRSHLNQVSATSGVGSILTSDGTQVDPFRRDLWFVGIKPVATVENPNTSELVEIFSGYQETLTGEPNGVVCVYNDGDTVQVVPAVAYTDKQEAETVAERSGTCGPTNFHRLELSKAALVVDESTHRPGVLDASFCSDDGSVYTSRDLGYVTFLTDRRVSYHPLGVFVERRRDWILHRPVVDAEETGESGRIELSTYRGGDCRRPWQFDLVRTDDALLLTQAMATPDRFDPVLKRFPVETVTQNEPLVFSETVRTVTWQEDGTRVRSNRLAGDRLWVLYRDRNGWHLDRPTVPDGDAEGGTFRQTTIEGVERRVSKTSVEEAPTPRAQEFSGTVREVEYRLTEPALITYRDVYVLTGHEQREESVQQYQWRMDDATAYRLVPEEHDYNCWSGMDRSGALAAGAVIDWARRTGRNPDTIDADDFDAFDQWIARGQPSHPPIRRDLDRVLGWLDDPSNVERLFELYREYEIYTHYPDRVTDNTE